MSNNKKITNKTSSFPLACILFLVGSILFFAYIYFDDASTMTSASDTTISVSGIGSVIIIFIPFFLMAFSSTNTSKKPSIFFLTVVFLQGCLSSISFIGAVVVCIQCFQHSIVQGLVNIIPVIAIIVLTLGYFCVFAFSLIVKIAKKPSKICKLWVLFPSVSAIGYLISFVGRFANFILAITNTFDSVRYLIMGLIAVFFYAIVNLIITGAFFAVCYQFAKINKYLPIEE